MKIHIRITDDRGNNYEGNVELVKVEKINAKLQSKPHQAKIRKQKAAKKIHQLYVDNFFKTEKSTQDVLKKLESTGFNFEESAIRMALNRSDYLKKKEVNKVNKYIQKYPSS